MTFASRTQVGIYGARNLFGVRLQKIGRRRLDHTDSFGAILENEISRPRDAVVDQDALVDFKVVEIEYRLIELAEIVPVLRIGRGLFLGVDHHIEEPLVSGGQ